MIGQENNKALIDRWAKEGCPGFIIISGARGSGKKLLADYIANKVSEYTAIVDKSVDSIRDVITSSYNCDKTTTFQILDADKMSVQAKNALLKVTEEPPKKSRFIMTVQDIDSTLGTLKSRAAHIPMENYTKPMLMQVLGVFDQLAETVAAIVDTPGQALELIQLDVQAFVDFCNKVIDNIGMVTSTNALKIGQSLRYKEDEAGYDPELFLNGLSYVCCNRLFVRMFTLDNIEVFKYTQTIEYCSKYKSQLRITGIKKDATIDEFILKIKELWEE